MFAKNDSWFFVTSQAEQDISSREKNAEQLQDELAAQDESITKLSKEKKALEEAKQVRHSRHHLRLVYADKYKINKNSKNKLHSIITKKQVWLRLVSMITKEKYGYD